jgi:uncharacterized membrane protein
MRVCSTLFVFTICFVSALFLYQGKQHSLMRIATALDLGAFTHMLAVVKNAANFQNLC